MRYKINDLELISFYIYEEIEDIIKRKYDKFGDKILQELAKISITPFFEKLELKANIVPIDDNPNNFSHTAILARSIKSKNFKVCYNTLRAKSCVKYAGKKLDFRKQNPKNFELKKKLEGNIILLDDVVTTGSTISQAKEILEKNDCQVIFAVSLCRIG